MSWLGSPGGTFLSPCRFTGSVAGLRRRNFGEHILFFLIRGMRTVADPMFLSVGHASAERAVEGLMFAPSLPRSSIIPSFTCIRSQMLAITRYATGAGLVFRRSLILGSTVHNRKGF